MNVVISMNAAEVQEQLDTSFAEHIRSLNAELDSIFKNRISTPEQVIDIHKKLEQYKLLTGENYKITFEENTIV